MMRNNLYSVRCEVDGGTGVGKYVVLAFDLQDAMQAALKDYTSWQQPKENHRVTEAFPIHEKEKIITAGCES